jgi:hypothetical protein
MLSDDLESVSPRYRQLFDHGLVRRVTDQAQVLAGTALKQIDVTSGMASIPPEISS